MPSRLTELERCVGANCRRTGAAGLDPRGHRGVAAAGGFACGGASERRCTEACCSNQSLQTGIVWNCSSFNMCPTPCHRTTFHNSGFRHAGIWPQGAQSVLVVVPSFGMLQYDVVHVVCSMGYWSEVLRKHMWQVSVSF